MQLHEERYILCNRTNRLHSNIFNIQLIGVEYVFWTKTTSELTVKKQIIRKKITMLFNVIRCAYVENFFQNITNDIINKY